jgi:hypothetical protein
MSPIAVPRLPSLTGRPLCRCGMNMWLCESRPAPGGIDCKFQCPVCEAIEEVILSSPPISPENTTP